MHTSETDNRGSGFAATGTRLLLTFWQGDGPAVRTARVLAIVAIVLITCIVMFEEKLIYFPARYPEGVWEVNRPPAREGEIIPHIEDVFFTAADGVKLHGWYCSPRQVKGGQPEPIASEMVLLWFHGNAGNVTYRYDMIQMLVRLPVEIFIIDYRGYGKSEGVPSEEGLYKDASASWEYLTNARNIKSDRVVLLGKSLGGVPAIDLAARVSPAGLIVQSSFTSAADMAAAIMPVFPRMFLRTKMESLEKIKGVRCRKLFVHSPADEVVPFALGRKLYDAAPEPKEFYEVAGAGHNETYMAGGKAYFNALRAFIERCKPVEER